MFQKAWPSWLSDGFQPVKSFPLCYSLLPSLPVAVVLLVAMAAAVVTGCLSSCFLFRRGRRSKVVMFLASTHWGVGGWEETKDSWLGGWSHCCFCRYMCLNMKWSHDLLSSSSSSCPGCRWCPNHPKIHQGAPRLLLPHLSDDAHPLQPHHLPPSAQPRGPH